MTPTTSTAPKPALKPWVPPAKPLTGAPKPLTGTLPLRAAQPSPTALKPVLGKPWVPPGKAAAPAVQPASKVLSKTPSPGSAPPPPQKIQPPETVAITGEHVFQRLRYFENLTAALFGHVKVLTAQVLRTGTAPATLPDYPRLKSPAGDFDPSKQ